MAPHRIADAETVARYKEWAQEKCPEDDPDTALNKYVIKDKTQGIFFINETGDRCLWGDGKCLSRSDTSI
jgi:hypothetical protein